MTILWLKVSIIADGITDCWSAIKYNVHVSLEEIHEFDEVVNFGSSSLTMPSSHDLTKNLPLQRTSNHQKYTL